MKDSYVLVLIFQIVLIFFKYNDITFSILVSMKDLWETTYLSTKFNQAANQYFCQIDAMIYLFPKIYQFLAWHEKSFKPYQYFISHKCFIPVPQLRGMKMRKVSTPKSCINQKSVQLVEQCEKLHAGYGTILHKCAIKLILSNQLT